MAKSLEEIVFDPARCRKELCALRKLLDSKKEELAERSDIQSFFKNHKQLAAFMGTYAGDVGPANLIAFEFPFMGDFAADIVLGNKNKSTFCVVEDSRTVKLNSYFQEGSQKN